MAAVIMGGGGGNLSLNGGASAVANGAINGPPTSPATPDAFLPLRARHTASSTVHSNVHVKLAAPSASALSVDAKGSIAVLASRRGLHLVDLEEPYALAATLHHQTKWDVTATKFNPHVECRCLVAATAHSNTLVWNVAQSVQTASYTLPTAQPPLVATLRGHTRPVSDIGWAPTEPTLLATSSSDAKTHLWDMRAPQRPVRTLHSVPSSAVQLAWHRVDATTLATSHEGEVRIWDTRGSDKTPAIAIPAHLQRIVGIDWHPKRLDEFLTCSEDKTVKLWNVAHPRACQGTLSTTSDASVVSAKYAPFGDAIVTSSDRPDTALQLWHLAYGSGGGDLAAGGTITLDQVHAFTGHSDVVKSFEWRERSSSLGSQYQLVSWTKSQELCMWRVDPHQLRACGHDVQAEATTGTAGSPENGSSEVSFDQVTESLDLISSRQRFQAVSKYDPTTLKNDFAPLAVPPAAVPLGASEYSLVQGGHEENNVALRALLTFDDDLSKIGGDGNASEDDEENDDENDGAASRLDQSLSVGVGTRSDKANPLLDAALSASSMMAALPCPRIFGACFSGPNVLVMFDSRVALDQSRHLAATPPVAPVAPGKSAKPAPAPPVLKKMPRTYEQLLDMRDSRFSKKKNKKSPPPRILSGAVRGMGGGAMELGSEWGTGVPLEFMDTSGGFGQEDTGDHSVHGKQHRSVNRNTGGFFNAAGIEGGGADNEFAVHGASEYLQKYFSNAHEQVHGPILHPDHRTSAPLTASLQGLSLSPPRASMAASSGMIRGGFVGTPLNLNDPRAPGKRTTDPATMSSLQLDLSLSVTLLDLSRLCGVSSVLTYGTQLNVTSSAASAAAARDVDNTPLPNKLDAGTHDLYSWMLKATASRRISGRIQSRRTRRGTNLSSPVLTSQKVHPLSRILQSLLADGSDSVQGLGTSISDVCEYNARIASLAGRSDLQQVWALLKLTTASSVQTPPPHQPPLQQKQQLKTLPLPSDGAARGAESLATSHPWRAHPFGQNLVNKVLAMYEDSSDIPTLAAIACALQPPSLPQDDGADNMAEDTHQIHKYANEFSLLQHGATVSIGSTASTAPPTPSTMSTTSFAPAKAPTGSPFNRSRTSFNNLTQLLGGQQSDAFDAAVAPPAMRNARRSTSHNEVARLAAAAERGESPRLVPNKAGAKDWPMTTTTARGNRQQLQASPALGPTPVPSGWKALDFDKMENPFKTWSSGSTAARAETSPRPLTSDTFRPPGTPLSLAASMPLRRHRGSSIVDSDDETSLASRILVHVDKRHGDDEHHVLSTDPESERRYGAYKEAYAEVLYQYGALNLRGDVLKSTAPDTASWTSGEEEDDEGEDRGLRFGVLCRSCQSVSNGLYCSACRDFSIKCSVCQLVVRGQSMYCMTCGHGGHEQHMREWFEEENTCPTGCGCWCKQATAMAMPSVDGRGATMEQLPLVAENRSRSYSF